jgi:hypothetical protein
MKLTDSRQVIIDKDILPMPLGRVIHLVHDTEMGMGLCYAVPPVPGLAVQRAVGEGVKIFEGAEVADDHDLVAGALFREGCPAGVAEDSCANSSTWKVCREGIGILHLQPYFSPPLDKSEIMLPM